MFNKLIIAASIALVSTVAAAADAPQFYVGGDIGTTKLKGESDRETGAGIFAGYAFNQNIAIEGGYRRLASADIVEQGVNVNVKIDQLALSVVGTIPLENNFSIYGRLGMNRLTAKASAGNVSESDHENKVLFGAGVGYNFTPTIVGRVEVQKPSSDLTNLSFGVAFKF